MPTSSIYASFDINDSDTLTRFLDALEASEADERNRPKTKAPDNFRFVTDPEEIKAFFAKGKQAE